MKRLIYVLALVILVSGCTVVQRKAENLIIDSDYSKYEISKSDLEKAYINGEISYSDYRSKMNELEQDRLKSEKEREEILFK